MSARDDSGISYIVPAIFFSFEERVIVDKCALEVHELSSKEEDVIWRSQKRCCHCNVSFGMMF